MDNRSWIQVLIYCCNYIGYRSAIDFLQWDIVKSTSRLDYKGANFSMGPCGPHLSLVFMVMVYEG